LPLTQSKLYCLRFYPELQVSPSGDLQWVFFQLFSSYVLFFGGAIDGLIYSIYDLNSVFLLTIFVGITWWFLMITLPQKVETLQE